MINNNIIDELINCINEYINECEKDNYKNTQDIINYINEYQKGKNKKKSKWAHKCEYNKCNNNSRYGYEKYKPIYCRVHKENNMYDVLSRKCIITGCLKQPSFGIIEKKPIVCKEHSTYNMKDVKSKKCVIRHCVSRASYGFTHATHCNLHKLSNMKRK